MPYLVLDYLLSDRSEKIREFYPEEVQVLASVVHSIVVFIYRYKMQCVQSQHFYTQLRPTTMMKIMKMMKSYLLLREGNNNYNLLAHLVSIITLWIIDIYYGG